MMLVTLTFALGALAVGTAKLFGHAWAFVVLTAVVVLGPYALGIGPRNRRERLAILLCIGWLYWWLLPESWGSVLRSR